MSNRRRTNAKPLRAVPGRKSRVNKKQDPVLLLKPEYPGQPCVTHKIWSLPSVLTTTVTTGVVALEAQIASTLINNFSTRFGLYDQYRLIKCTARVRMFSSQNPGVLVMWVSSEANGSPPTLNMANNAMSQRKNFADIDRVLLLSFTPHNPGDQIWNDIAAPQVIGAFQFYSDAVNFGSGITATNVALVDFELTVQFRGFV